MAQFSLRPYTEEATLMKREQLEDLLWQALETEMGGIQVYTAALECVQNDELRREWEEGVKTAIGAARAQQARTEML